MKKYIYKTSLIIFLLSLLQMSAFAVRSESNSIYNPSGSPEYGVGRSPFGESAWSKSSPVGDDIFAVSLPSAEKVNGGFQPFAGPGDPNDPNNTGEPEAGLIVPVGVLPLLFISICIFLYSLYCFMRFGKKTEQAGFSTGK